jgi:hypothetical protein
MLTLRFTILLVALPWAMAGCDEHKTDDAAPRAAPIGQASARAPATASPEAPKVHTDVAGLRSYVKLPEGVAHARWILRTRGDGVLGPSDYSVTAYVELNPAGWSQLACDAGAPAAPHSLLLDAPEARSLLPGDLVVTLSPMQGEFKVPSIPLPGCLQPVSVLDIRTVDRIGNGIWIDAYTK